MGLATFTRTTSSRGGDDGGDVDGDDDNDDDDGDVVVRDEVMDDVNLGKRYGDVFSYVVFM